MNKLSSALKCVNCLNLLNCPVLLPCCHSICKNHTDNLKGPVICLKCGKEHSIPANGGFPYNEALADIIDTEITSLDFGVKHAEAKHSCQTLDELLTTVECILQDPFIFTFEVFNCLKNAVQLKGEEMKLRIDEQMNNWITKLEEEKLACRKSLSSVEFLTESDRFKDEKEATRKKLDNWLFLLNKIRINEEEWNRIKDESQSAIKNLEIQLIQFKVDLLFPKRFVELRHEIEKDFGKFDIDSQFDLEEQILKNESKILHDFNMKLELFNLCGLKLSQKWNILYRGSLHGFRASDFHAKCDNIQKTLTLIKATDSGHIFGGYTEASWDQISGYKSDKSAFLFNLVNSESRPAIRVNIANGKEDDAIFCHSMYGPTFGDGRDLKIGENSNVYNSNYSNFCCSYVLKHVVSGSPMAKNFLAGSFKFTGDEIEVFKLE